MTAPTDDAVQAAREPSDPMERIIARALRQGGFQFASDMGGGTASNLDFEVRNGPAIEVKRLHSPRIAEQMSRVEDVIAVQGEGAVQWFAALIERLATLERERDEALKVIDRLKLEAYPAHGSGFVAIVTEGGGELQALQARRAAALVATARDAEGGA